MSSAVHHPSTPLASPSGLTLAATASPERLVPTTAGSHTRQASQDSAGSGPSGGELTPPSSLRRRAVERRRAAGDPGSSSVPSVPPSPERAQAAGWAARLRTHSGASARSTSSWGTAGAPDGAATDSRTSSMDGVSASQGFAARAALRDPPQTPSPPPHFRRGKGPAHHAGSTSSMSPITPSQQRARDRDAPLTMEAAIGPDIPPRTPPERPKFAQAFDALLQTPTPPRIPVEQPLSPSEYVKRHAHNLPPGFSPSGAPARQSPQSAHSGASSSPGTITLQQRRSDLHSSPLVLALPQRPVLPTLEESSRPRPTPLKLSSRRFLGVGGYFDEGGLPTGSSQYGFEPPASGLPLLSPTPSYFALPRLMSQQGATPGEAATSVASSNVTTPSSARPLLKRSGTQNMFRQLVMSRTGSAEPPPSAGLRIAGEVAQAGLTSDAADSRLPLDDLNDLVGEAAFGWPGPPMPELLPTSGTQTPALSPAQPRTPSWLRAEEVASTAPERSDVPWPNGPKDRFFVRTWPAWLFAANVLGTFISSAGAIGLERAVYATRAVMAQSPAGGPTADRGHPELLGWFSGPVPAMAYGASLSAIGLTMSLTSCYRFWLDGRALARRSGQPGALRRPNRFFAGNVAVTTSWFVYRYFGEAFRDHKLGDLTWTLAPVGAGSVAFFAYVQAISIGASERARGHVLFERHHARRTVAQVARGGGPAMVSLFAQLAATPDSSPLLRQLAVSLYSAMLTIANVAPLTYVRDLTPGEMDRAAPSAWRPEPPLEGIWSFFPRRYRPLALLALHELGRLASGIGAVPIGHLIRQAQKAAKANAMPGPPKQDGLHFPTLKDMAPHEAAVAGVVGLAVGSALQVAATAGLMVYTKRITKTDWWLLGVVGIAGTVALVAHRLINEGTQPPYAANWQSANILLGAFGTGAQTVSLSDLVALSQVECGRPRVPYFNTTLDALRIIGSVLWFLWGFESAFVKFPGLAREFTFVVGQATWILGIALATGAVAHSQVRRARELESIRLATFTGTTSAAALPAPGNAGRVPQLRQPPPPKRKVSDYDADSFNEWADATAVAP